MHTFKAITGAAVLAGTLALAGAPAQAAAISLTGGTYGQIPDSGQANDVLNELGISAPLGGYFGAEVTLAGSSPLRVELLGYEAGYPNVFSFAGNGFSTETDDPTPGDNRETFATPPAYTTGPLSGLLDFVFSTIGGGSVANGANPADAGDGPTGVNFFASIVGDPTATSGRSVMLFFDDNGADNDDDHDDMVVRVSAVPLPASLPFLLAALTGLGVIGRLTRRARVAA